MNAEESSIPNIMAKVENMSVIGHFQTFHTIYSNLVMASNWYHTCSLDFFISRLAFMSPRPEQFHDGFHILVRRSILMRKKVLILCLGLNPSIISRFGQISRKHRHFGIKPFHVRLFIARRDNQALPPDYYSFLLPRDRAAVIGIVIFRGFVSNVYCHPTENTR